MAPTSSVLLGLLSFAAAFPTLMERAAGPGSECNTGPICSTTFNAADQYVDVSPGSAHAFVAPKATDLRGQCPGLNAAANHGFIPHNGLLNIQQTITGLADAYNMSPDLAGFLAVVSIALSGDFITQRWSIGGAFPAGAPLLSEPQGIIGTHNKYEGDASIGRNDAYLENGNPAVLQISRFDQFYNMGNPLTFDMMRQHNVYTQKYSVQNNPHYFSAPFSGAVTPAAHNFVMNFMSNHSAAEPSGVLTRKVLKQFFSVQGPDNAHTHTIGHERIPENWYKRPSSNQYNIPEVLADVAKTATAYPGSVVFGGNTGTTNSFTGVNIADLTGGAFNGATLFQGNNLACFALQAFQAGLPDELRGVVNNIAPILNLVKKYTQPTLDNLDCPALDKYNTNLFHKYPGYNDSVSNTMK